MKKYKLLSNEITACNYDDILKEVINHIKSKRKILLCPIATYALTVASYNSKLAEILDKFILIADSQWVKIAISFLYGKNDVLRIRGTDLMYKILSLANKNKYRVCLYGTTESTLYKLKIKLDKLFPSLNIVDSIQSKFRVLSYKEKKELKVRIIKNRIDILFIALGSPLQEKFVKEVISSNPKISFPLVVITVGAAFDFISGIKLEAPRWIQDMGLEWLFRLICEPRRLWQRYLIYGPLFLFLVFRQKISILLQNLIKCVLVY